MLTTLYPLMRPLLFAMDAETAHNLTLTSMQLGLSPKIKRIEKPVQLAGLTFPNALGMAAGFDKNAEVIAPLFHMGFGAVEVGTVTPLPQIGNPRPRVHRDVDSHSIINAMGFPNKGLDVFRKNIAAYRDTHGSGQGIVGVNIGMNKDQTDPAADYTLLARELAEFADYLTINISSPNTPGLRNLQTREHMVPLIEAVKAVANNTPIFVKFAPDLNDAQKEELAAAVTDAPVDGIILTNTTLSRPDALPADFSAKKGGLSGPHVRDLATQTIRDFHRLTDGKVPIIGLGGIDSAAAAKEKLDAGASLLQLYTGLVFKGPGLVNDIAEGL